MDGRLARADVIRDRQRAAPCSGRHRPFERSQQRKGIRIRDGQDRNLGERLRVFDVEALCIGGCADARRERIAGIERHVCGPSSFRAPPPSPPPPPPHIPPPPTILPPAPLHRPAPPPLLLRPPPL